MAIATLDDYELRYGDIDDDDAPAIVTALADAGSRIKEEARLEIELVTDDTITVVGNGRTRLLLPEHPIVEVTSITVGTDPALDADTWRAWEWGGLDRRDGGRWPWDTDIAIVYTHGWDPVPDWLVALACTMVYRARRPAVVAGKQTVTTGSQTIQYAGTGAGPNLWFTDAELARVRALRGPLVE